MSVANKDFAKQFRVQFELTQLPGNFLSCVDAYQVTINFSSLSLSHLNFALAPSRPSTVHNPF